jgi:phenylpyruvate tautomerase PptA (4-oxalocrotonate tautomerase family)
LKPRDCGKYRSQTRRLPVGPPLFPRTPPIPVFQAHIPAGRFTSEQKRALADALNQSLVQGLGIPEEDRFVILSDHKQNELYLHPTFLGMNRGPDAMIITVLVGAYRAPLPPPRAAEWLPSYSLDEKRKVVVAAINRLVVEATGVSPDDIFIALIPGSTENFSLDAANCSWLKGATRWMMQESH